MDHPTNATYAPPVTFVTSGVALAVTGTIGTIGSILCFALLLKPQPTSRTPSPSSVPLFLSLTTATFIFTAFFAPLSAYVSFKGLPNFLATESFLPLCQLIGFLYLTAFFTCVVLHAAVAMDRCFTVVLSNRFPVLKSKHLTWTLAIIPWIMSVTVFLFPVGHLGGEYGWNASMGRCAMNRIHALPYHIFIRTFFILFSLPIMLVCYVGIFVKLRLSKRRVGNYRGAAPTRGSTARMKAEIFVTKIAFSACLTYMVCFLPSMVHGFVAKSSAELFSPFGDGLVILCFIGCSVTPWMVVWSNRSLRSGVRHLFFRKTSRQATVFTLSSSRNRSVL